VEKINQNYKNNISREYLLAGIFLVSALFVETITFLILGFNALPQYLLLDIAILFMIVGFSFILPTFKLKQALYIFVIAFQVVVSFINTLLYNIFGTVATIDMLNLVKDATTATENSVINFGMLSMFLGILAVYIALNVIFFKKFKVEKIEKKSMKVKLAGFMLIGFLVFQSIGYVAFEQGLGLIKNTDEGNFIGSDSSLYNTLLFEVEGLKKFGTFGFYFQDINTTFFGFNKNRDERIQVAKDYLNSGEVSPIGDYTGISAGNNVIVIMAESFEWYGVSEELTPTLYSLKTENVAMTNYYSKSNTNISESFGFLGSFPLTKTLLSHFPIFPKLTENDFSYSLPNLMKQEGYTGINYFINHDKTFYSRSNTHYNYGFNEIYDISDFSSDINNSTIERWGDWSLDSEFFKAGIDLIAPENETEPFFNWVTTMVMHGPYYGNSRLQPYYDTMELVGWENPFAGTGIENYYKNYVAAVMDLDEAIRYLLEELEDRNLIDNTTIVIYGDHETYYHDLGIQVKGIPVSEYQNPEIYNVPFMIYDNNLPIMEITDFTCPYDIMPTIMDLIGISYNKNMYLGNSVLNSTEKTKAFLALTGGILNNSLFTSNGIDVYNPDSSQTEEDISDFLYEVNELIQKLIIFTDLYYYDLFNE